MRTIRRAPARHRQIQPPHFQRGFLLIMAVVLIVIAALLLTVMMFLGVAGNESSAAHSQAKQAVFAAESGVEYATRQYVTSAAPCSRAAPETRSFGNGEFTIADGTTPASFDPTMNFDNVTPLSSGRCRLRVTGTMNDASRMIEAIVEPGGAITFVAASSNTTGGGPNATSLSVAQPVGVVAGDVMLAQLTVRANICAGSGPTPPASGGWILIGCLNSGTTLAQAVYYKVATAAEPANYTWSFSAGRATAGIAAFRGVNNATPVNVANSRANASSTNIVAPAITTTVANTMLVGLFGHAHSDAIDPPILPAIMTEAYDVTSGAGPNGTTSEAAYITQAAPGNTGTRTATSAGGNAVVNIGHLVALRPATGGAGGGAQIVGWREVFR